MATLQTNIAYGIAVNRLRKLRSGSRCVKVARDCGVSRQGQGAAIPRQGSYAGALPARTPDALA